jgi:thymidylate synthase (FAD)
MSELGSVRLDACMADDMSVVNSARISFNKQIETMSEADEALINFLMRERHGTPFEHNAFRFHIKAPIFVAREWFRHRIGSFNEFSGRYTEFTPDAYTPPVEDIRTQSGKPGQYTFEPADPDIAQDAIEHIEHAYKTAFDAYNHMLLSGVAKEIARTVIPVGAYTEFYWTVNARSLMNFISLRTHETAQLEIQAFAQRIEYHFAQQMPITHKAFTENGRKAP